MATKKQQSTNFTTALLFTVMSVIMGHRG